MGQEKTEKLNYLSINFFAVIKFSLEALQWQERFTYLKNIPFDEKILHQKGSKFQIIRFLPHTSIVPHFHKNVCEIFYVRRGKGTFLFNGQKTAGNADDFFLCQPGDVHEIRNDADEDLVILIFKTNEDPDDIVWVEV